jgi:hypothetical protein
MSEFQFIPCKTVDYLFPGYAHRGTLDSICRMSEISLIPLQATVYNHTQAPSETLFASNPGKGAGMWYWL